HAYPEAHFSVLLPDGGVQLEGKKLKMADAEFADATWLGGSEQRIFMVSGWRLDGARSPDERLDGAVARLEQAGNRVIWQSPQVIDDARARDVLMQGTTGWMRLRLLITGTHLYLLQASAQTKPGVLDDSVTRFFTSFRRY